MTLSKITRTLQEVRDERWTSKDKLSQYRGILRLCGREKSARIREASSLKHETGLKLARIRANVQEYRGIIGSGVRRHEGHVHAILQDRTDLRLRCAQHGMEETCAALEEENHLKRKRLEKHYYQKQKKVQQCLVLQLERIELSREYEKMSEGTSATNRTKQILVTRYQRSMAKHQAAKAIRSTYTSVLTILKQDSLYHEQLLNQLLEDQKGQCTVILKATLVGQLAAESVDDTSTRYRRIAVRAWSAMKKRERALNCIRNHVDDVWNYGRSLIPTESSTDILGGKDREPSLKTPCDEEIELLERAFASIRESLLANSYLELFSRLEEQAKQRARLFEQFQRNARERESCLSKRLTALTELSSAERSLLTATERYRSELGVLLDQIEFQRKREAEQKISRKNHGELILEIKAALRNMVAMLIAVKKGSKIKKDETDEFGESEKRLATGRIETEGLALLSDVSRKVGALFGMSNFDLEPDKEDKAKDMYRSYVSDCRSRLAFGRAETNSTSFFVEHEAIDSLVPTRGQIKMRSKQIIESHSKLE